MRALGLVTVTVALGCRRTTPLPVPRTRPPEAVCVPAPECPPFPAEDPLDDVPQWRRVRAILAQPAESVDVGEVSLLLASLRDPDVDVPANLRRLDAMAAEVRRSTPSDCGPRCRLDALTRRMFRVWRFRAADDPNGLYDDPSYDLLDRVLAGRSGYCEGLSVLYLALAHRLDIPLAGVLARQHMYVRYVGPGPSVDVDATREGAAPLPDEPMGTCHPADGVYGRPLDARSVAAVIVAEVGILDGIPARRQWLDEAVALAPDDPDLRNNRAVERERWDDLAGALEDYRRATALDPCVALYRTNAAEVLARLGRADEALAMLDGVAARRARGELEDDALFPPLARADVLLERGDDAEAEAWYHRAETDSERAPAALASHGWALVQMGRADEGATTLLASLEADPRGETRLLLVEALAARGAVAEAESELGRAERDHAPPEDVAEWRAVLAAAAGRWEEAEAAARECLVEGGPRCARALVVLGDVARARGDAVCARRYWEGYLACPGPRDRARRVLETAVGLRLSPRL